MKKCSVPQEEEVSSYYTIRQQLANLNDSIHGFLVKPKYIVPFLQAGRMVHVSYYLKDIARSFFDAMLFCASLDQEQRRRFRMGHCRRL